MLLTSDRLKGQWGIVDVQDTIEAVKQLSASPYSLIDPKRLCIRGGSAGGFTVLAALCDKENPTVFAAGTSSYGVSDLKKVRESLVVADCQLMSGEQLAADTHKFESRYETSLSCFLQCSQQHDLFIDIWRSLLAGHWRRSLNYTRSAAQ
jgi:hypothetical protein